MGGVKAWRLISRQKPHSTRCPLTVIFAMLIVLFAVGVRYGDAVMEETPGGEQGVCRAEQVRIDGCLNTSVSSCLHWLP